MQMMWTGAEPVEGQYNMSYYETQLEIAKLLGKYGIYTLFDAHQDVLSSFFCLYGIFLYQNLLKNNGIFILTLILSFLFIVSFIVSFLSFLFYRFFFIVLFYRFFYVNYEDGAPRWLVEKSLNDSHHPFPWPLKGPCINRPWGSNYLTEATGRAFQDIYSNRHGMKTSFLAFWAQTAKYFSTSQIDTILGYEILNEPWV